MGISFKSDAYQYASIADANDLDVTDWTVALRLRFQTLPSGAGVFVAKGDAGAWNYAIGFDYLAGEHQIALYFNDAVGGYHGFAIGTVTLEKGRYYAVFGTWDSATQLSTLYWAAMEGPTSAGATEYTQLSQVDEGGGVACTTNSSPILLGSSRNDSGVFYTPYEVDIAEACFYNVALSKATMDARLNTRLVGNEAGLVAYIRADDKCLGVSDPDYAYDRTGNGHHATLVNHPTWCDDPQDLYYSTGVYTGTIVGYHNAIWRSGVTIAASNEASEFPASTLRDPKPNAVTRTTTTSGVALKIEANTSDAWGSPAVSETVTPAHGRIRHILAKPYQFRYWRLSVGDRTWTFSLDRAVPVGLLTIDNHNLFTAVADGYVELGHVGLWCVWQSSNPADLTDAICYNDLSTAVHAKHGHYLSRSRAKPRSYTLGWPVLTKGEAMELRRILHAIGSDGRCCVCPDVKRSLHPLTFYGLIQEQISEQFIDPTGGHRQVRSVTVAEESW